MAYRIINPTTHEEWLEERKKGIGSSDAGTILGVNPFSTPKKLYELRKGLREPDPETDIMAEGHILEPAIAEWFAWKTGNIVDITSEGDWMAVDVDREYLRVSPDRLWWPKGTPVAEQTLENARILEIKRTGKAVYKDDLPDYWYCQIQYQMGVMGLKHGALCWLSLVQGPTHFDYQEIDFNPPFFEMLIAKIDRFWNENLAKSIVPPDINADDTLRSFPVAKRVNKKADDEAYRTWNALKECIKRCKELEGLKDDLTDRLKCATAEADTLVYTDEDTGKVITLATWKNSQKEVFDEERLLSEDPELHKEYEVSTTTVSFDSNRLKLENPDVFKKYTNKTVSSRRFLVK